VLRFAPVGLKQIIQNFSFETLANLPPSELLSLILIPVALAFILLTLAWMFSH
jgi:hypothetical protein